MDSVIENLFDKIVVEAESLKGLVYDTLVMLIKKALEMSSLRRICRFLLGKLVMTFSCTNNMLSSIFLPRTSIMDAKINL